MHKITSPSPGKVRVEAREGRPGIKVMKSFDVPWSDR